MPSGAKHLLLAGRSTGYAMIAELIKTTALNSSLGSMPTTQSLTNLIVGLVN